MAVFGLNIKSDLVNKLPWIILFNDFADTCQRISNHSRKSLFDVFKVTQIRVDADVTFLLVNNFLLLTICGHYCW